MPHANARVVFLTTYPGEKGKSYNIELSKALEERGAHVSFLCWREASTTTDALGKFTHASVLTCGDYNYFIDELYTFLDNVLQPAVKQFGLRVINSVDVVRWNSNKIYLQDLLQAGLPLPPTTFIDASGKVEAVQKALAERKTNDPVVVKPSISASGYSTHIVRNPQAIAADTETLKFLETAVNQPAQCYIMLQDFMPGIAQGEYSLCYVDGRCVFAVLKTPAKGDWRVYRRYGGTNTYWNPDQVPSAALQVAERVWAHLDRRFNTPDEVAENSGPGLVYARIDGVMDTKGQFWLMEVELLEPNLFMPIEGFGPRIVAALCDAMLTSSE